MKRTDDSYLTRGLRLAAGPLVLAFMITLLRFLGERRDLPSLVTFLFGIIWLTFIVAVYWGWRLRKDTAPYRLLLISLAVFSLASRVPVVALWWVTSRYGLGTHYDMYRDFPQALVFQFGVSATIQIALGFVVGAAVLAAARRLAPGAAPGAQD